MNATPAWLGACLLVPLLACGGDSGPPPPPSPGGGGAPAAETGGSEPDAEAPAATAWSDALGTATVSGKVAFVGEAPTMAPHDMSSDPKCASDGATQETVLVADGGLANCVISVTKGLEGFTFEEASGKVAIDQKGCTYVPHVVAMQIGQTLSISNSDDTVHNVHSYSKRNNKFNEAHPVGAPPIEKEMGRRDKLFPVKCDMHAWMICHVAVFEHPFFTVSDESGRFTLPKLPAGTYTLTAEHETLGKQTTEVTVADGATATAALSFQP